MARRELENGRLPLPNGWFAVAFSHELREGEVRPLHYFGEDLVLFRTRSGRARVLDAFCPHLGAHLGHGGRVMGESVRCPFHGWSFDGASGSCTQIPYCERIPQQALVRARIHQRILLAAFQILLDRQDRLTTALEGLGVTVE